MKKRLYALDLLRFILAALVVVLHFFDVYGYSVAHDSHNFVPIFGVPFFHMTLSRAVDVFFVLSGFTMVYSTRNNPLGLTFLKKRAARIFPLYLLATIAAVPFFMMISPASPQHKVFTFSYIIDSIILRPNDQLFLISVAWTLSFEWVFYVVFAFVMSIKHKYRVQIVSVVFLITMCLSYYITFSSGYMSVLFDDRLLLVEFIAGMWIAYYSDKLKIPHGWILCLMGTVLMYCTVFTPLFDLKYRGLVFVIPSVLIVIGALNIQVQEKFHKIFRVLGDISYTMYIMHTFTAFAFAYLLYNVVAIRSNAWFWLALSMVLTVGVSLFVNRFIEKPLYNYLTQADKIKK